MSVSPYIDAEVVDGGVSVSDYVPIFISTLRCNRDDATILSCGREAPIGVTNCIHSQDVYVRCHGMH